MSLQARAGGLKRVHWVALGIVVLGGVILLAIGRVTDFGTGINKSGYQMVTLSSGERFIGKLSGLSKRYVTLENVYYQQQNKEGDSATNPNEVVVVSYSGSVAKPENSMQILSDKIIHWENLQDDSKVVQAIRQDSTQ